MAEPHDQDPLLGYIEGDLSPDDAARFEAKMAADESLRKLVRELQADREALRRMERVEPPEGLIDPVIAGLERTMLLGGPGRAAAAPSRQRFRMARLLSYSGVAALLLVSAGLFWMTLTDSGAPEDKQLKKIARAFEASGLEEDDLEMRDGFAADKAVAAKDYDETAGKLAMQSRTESDLPASSPPAEGRAKQEASEADQQTSERLIAMARTRIDAVGRNAAVTTARGTDVESALAGVQPHPFGGKTGLIDLRMAKGSAFGGAAPSRIDVTTSSASEARQDVIRWAQSNAASIVDAAAAKPLSVLMTESGPAKADKEGQSLEQTSRDQVIVVIQPAQAPQLAAYLDTRRSRQRAILVQASDQTARRVGRSNRNPAAPLTSKRALAPDEDRFATQSETGADAVPTYARERAAAEPSDRILARRQTAQKPDLNRSARYRSGSFDWGRVLEQQLPLVEGQPLARMEEGTLMLPVLINELPAEAASMLRTDPAAAEPATDTGEER